METKLGRNSPVVLTFYTESEQNAKGIQASSKLLATLTRADSVLRRERIANLTKM